MPRWECPNGKHKAVIGPGRPHADHLCRYCLVCSAGAGRLIRRTCPSVEKTRAAKQERRKERLKDRAERERIAAATFPNSLNADFRRWAKLKAWDGGDFSKWRFELRVRRNSADTYHTSGRCWVYRNRIVITAGRDEAWARYVVLHELAHAAAYRAKYKAEARGIDTKTAEWESHGSIFRAILKTAVEEVVGHRVEMKAYTGYQDWRPQLVEAIAEWMKPALPAQEAAAP